MLALTQTHDVNQIQSFLMNTKSSYPKSNNSTFYYAKEAAVTVDHRNCCFFFARQV